MSSRRSMVSLLAVLVMVGSVVGIGASEAQARPNQQDYASVVTHYLIQVDGEVQVNRLGWDDFNSYSNALVGTPLRSRDYLQVSGSSTAMILCADLTIEPQSSDGVVDCRETDDPAFWYANDVEWPAEGFSVFVSGSSALPEEAAGVETLPIGDSLWSDVQTKVSAINALALDTEQRAYAIANVLASYGLYYDAINTLRATEGLQCLQRPFVNIDGEVTTFEAPTVYTRLGEWYHIVGGSEASLRFLNCAFELSGQLTDSASGALAAARLAQFSQDAAGKIEWYQRSIDTYATLTAIDSAETLLGACGSANCVIPAD